MWYRVGACPPRCPSEPPRCDRASRTPRSSVAPCYFFHDFFFVEWIRSRATNLIRLVSLPGQKNDVIFAGKIDRAPNGADPVSDELVLRAAHSRFDVVDDGIRVFGTGIVASNYSAVGIAFGNLTHQRTLSLVAVAATAKHHDQLTAGKSAYCFQAPLERVQRVCVVSQDRWVRRDDFQSTRHLRNCPHAFDDSVGRYTDRE